MPFTRILTPRVCYTPPYFTLAKARCATPAPLQALHVVDQKRAAKAELVLVVLLLIRTDIE